MTQKNILEKALQWRHSFLDLRLYYYFSLSGLEIDMLKTIINAHYNDYLEHQRFHLTELKNKHKHMKSHAKFNEFHVNEHEMQTAC